jgi:hypothetical protein
MSAKSVEKVSSQPVLLSDLNTALYRYPKLVADGQNTLPGRAFLWLSQRAGLQPSDLIEQAQLQAEKARVRLEEMGFWQPMQEDPSATFSPAELVDQLREQIDEGDLQDSTWPITVVHRLQAMGLVKPEVVREFAMYPAQKMIDNAGGMRNLLGL